MEDTTREKTIYIKLKKQNTAPITIQRNPYKLWRKTQHAHDYPIYYELRNSWDIFTGCQWNKSTIQGYNWRLLEKNCSSKVYNPLQFV